MQTVSVLLPYWPITCLSLVECRERPSIFGTRTLRRWILQRLPVKEYFAMALTKCLHLKIKLNIWGF